MAPRPMKPTVCFEDMLLDKIYTMKHDNQYCAYKKCNRVSYSKTRVLECQTPKNQDRL